MSPNDAGVNGPRARRLRGAACGRRGQRQRRHGLNQPGDRVHGRADPVFDGGHDSSSSIRPSDFSARDDDDLTVPRLIPIAAAVSSSDRPK